MELTSQNNMKKYFIFALLAILITGMTQSATGQNLQESFKDLLQQEHSEYNSLEFELLRKKVPLDPRRATLPQLSDETKPTQQEKLELEKWQKLRARNVAKGNQFALTYFKPETHANNVVLARKDALKKEESVLIELYAGKINFGEFNVKRKDIYEELRQQESNLRRTLNEARAQAKRAPALTSATTPDLSNLSEPSSRLQEICNKLYWSAFSSADPSRGFGFASAEASKAEADCLAGKESQRKKSITCRQVGLETKCTED